MVGSGGLEKGARCVLWHDASILNTHSSHIIHTTKQANKQISQNHDDSKIFALHKDICAHERWRCLCGDLSLKNLEEAEEETSVNSS